MKPLYTELEYNQSKSREKLKCECYNCGSEFLAIKSNITHELIYKRGRVKFCNNKCHIDYTKTGKNVPCRQCGKIVYKSEKALREASNNFCGSSCNAKFQNSVRSEETQKKMTNSLNLHYIENGVDKIPTIKQCPYCGEEFSTMADNKFCKISCAGKWKFSDKNPNKEYYLEIARKSGLKASSLKNRRSKNEILFFEKCLECFPDAKSNPKIVKGWDCDVHLPSIQTCIHWDGNWHHKKITKKHSLKQVQNRDLIKRKEFTKIGLINYTILDYGNYNPEFVEQEFVKFLTHISGY